MNTKRIIMVTCLVLTLLLVFISLGSHTTNFSGVMVENGIKSNVNVNVSVKKRQIDKVLNRMTGNVFVQTNVDKNSLEYNFSESVFSSPSSLVSFVSVYRFNENRFENGYLYFDKELKNIVLITSERQVYAADDKFCDVVNKIIRND